MGNTNVLLVAPVPSLSSPQKSPPLGLLHIQRALAEAKIRGKSDEDYNVRLVDCRYDDPTPDDFMWADCVGVSSMTGVQIRGAIHWLKTAKQYGKRTILGGIHVTMCPQEALAEDYVDSVVLSEGEWAIIDAIHGGHKHVAHGHLNGTPDHVSPVSPETLIHFKRSARTGDTVLMTSRGCPFRCGFSVSGTSSITLSNGDIVHAYHVKIGDRLIGWDEQKDEFSPTQVIAVSSPLVYEKIRLQLMSGEAIVCSGEHPIMTRRGWVLASDLTYGDSILTFSHRWDSIRKHEVLPANEEIQINIQCYPHPTFIASGIVTHNCYIQQFFERSWQSVDLDRWRHDVLYLKEHAGVVKYEHGDDWIGKWPRAREIISFLHENGIEYRPSIRAHQINDDVAREMTDMGIKHISVGMETASERMLKLTEKDITKQDQLICAEALAKHNIWPLYYWITGFPTETKDEINETLDQADVLHRIHRGRLTQNFYAYTALPGSPLYDLVDKAKLPSTMEGWSNYSLNQTLDVRASNLYHVGGLYFHRGQGDKTDRNFPGWRRALIAPFEILAILRWRLRLFTHFGIEKAFIEALLKWASLRYENSTRKTKLRLRDVDIADWGVRENMPSVGARGEFLTGEIGNE